jgi:cysteinyl-tRNA synthetase
MSSDLLGKHFDIHGGGQDLQFPHHENEIAQSEGAHRCRFVNYWMHNGFVRVDDEKMSKSLGNFFTIREILKKYDPEVLRFLHPACPLPQPAELFRSPSRRCPPCAEPALHCAQGSATAEVAPIDWNQSQRFASVQAMNDDFNTPEACAVLFELAGEVNRSQVSGSGQPVAGLAGLLGLLTRDPQVFLQATPRERRRDFRRSASKR